MKTDDNMPIHLLPHGRLMAQVGCPTCGRVLERRCLPEEKPAETFFCRYCYLEFEIPEFPLKQAEYRGQDNKAHLKGEGA